eukprot:COSAG01_NODE_28578_length_657_cov_116.865591_1_plen_35_part_01
MVAGIVGVVTGLTDVAAIYGGSGALLLALGRSSLD